MLVLSRRCGEKIIIGNREVEMVVISYDKGQVKLGFEADKKIRINREEIFIKIEDEQQQPEVRNELAEYANSADAANDAVPADEDDQKTPDPEKQ